MARLPKPGADEGTWGEILNAFLLTSLRNDGQLKDDSITATKLRTGAVTGAKLSDGTVTENKLSTALKNKLNAASQQKGMVARAISDTYTAEDKDFIIAEASSGGFTITLPDAINGGMVSVKKVDSTYNAVLVVAPGGMIDDQLSFAVNNQWQSQDFFSDGSNWYRV